MAENLLLDVAQTVMIEKYGLDETEYKLFKFSEGAKNVTVGMTNELIPVTASFPIQFMIFEQMKRWSDEKKELYLRHLILEERELDEELVESFHHVMLKVQLPHSPYSSAVELDMEAGDQAIISLEGGKLAVVTETEEEVEEPVKAKKKLAKKSK